MGLTSDLIAGDGKACMTAKANRDPDQAGSAKKAGFRSEGQKRLAGRDLRARLAAMDFGQLAGHNGVDFLRAFHDLDFAVIAGQGCAANALCPADAATIPIDNELLDFIRENFMQYD
jgi:hypothetical protein